MQIPIKTNHPLNAILLAHADSERANKSGGVYHAPAGKEDHPVSVFHMMPPVAVFKPLVTGNVFTLSGGTNPPAIYKPFVSSGTPAQPSKPSIRSAVANLFSRGSDRG